MDSFEGESSARKIKRDESKCVSCQKYFRKGLKKAREIKTRDDAREFNQTYNFFVQVRDSICIKCYTGLRVRKFRKNTKVDKGFHGSFSANDPMQATSSTSHGPIEDEIDWEFSHSLSQILVEDTGDSGTSQKSSTFSENTSSLSQVTDSGSIYIPPDGYQCEEIEKITMPFQRVISSKSYCFICKSIKDIHDVPFNARIQVFVKRRIFIPKRNRCCSKHLIRNRFYEDEVQAMFVYSNESIIECTELRIFLDKLSSEIDSRLHNKIGDFAISEERVKALTGYNWDSILRISNLLQKMRKSSNRNVLQGLVIFLFKLRSGNSNQIIAAILEVSENIVQDSIRSVLDCFIKHILQKHFGIQAHSREDFLRETALAASLLYDLGNSSLVIICDGSYLHHEKSANNAYHRK